jgi:hypothetical protein
MIKDTHRMYRATKIDALLAENAKLKAEISKERDNKTAALDSITARAIQMVEELEAENDRLKAEGTVTSNLASLQYSDALLMIEQLRDHANEDREAHQAQITEIQGCCSCSLHSSTKPRYHQK